MKTKKKENKQINIVKLLMRKHQKYINKLTIIKY